MKTFTCHCGNIIHFQNSLCASCGRVLGFLPDQLVMSALEPADDECFLALPSGGQRELYRQCNNYRFEQVCNWMLVPGDASPYCRACRLNSVIPDLGVAENRALWFRIEQAKRRLFYNLFQLRLPVVGRDADATGGLCFAFLADSAAERRVHTGHENGLITLNVAEADATAREEMREEMGESYRTLLGHFRHEIGHFYWDRLVAGSAWLDAYRRLFGDERQDYAQALARHYAEGAPADWQQRFVSAYASVHPWEDWAESWAHYLHMIDTLETSAEFGFVVRGRTIRLPASLQQSRSGRVRRRVFDALIGDWGEMTLAMNAVNRSMGMPDPYPFVLAPAAIDKLYFVHCVIADSRVARGDGKAIASTVAEIETAGVRTDPLSAMSTLGSRTLSSRCMMRHGGK